MKTQLKNEIKLASKILGNAKLKPTKELLTGHFNYNCWGFTAFSMKWLGELTWMFRTDMEAFLKRKTKKIYKNSVKPGDIAVYRLKSRDKYLIHTAVVISPEEEMVLHKPGDEPLVFETLYNKYHYEYTSNITYRRRIA